MPKAETSHLIRLQKYIADCGITSRRKAEELISQGRVKVNGETVRELGSKVDLHNDSVSVDGKTIDKASIDHIYILFNKPRSCVTTLSDPEGRPTVIDYMKGIPQRVYPVGRLDYYSEGLIILTNDGDMANLIMHPKHEVTKVYEVKVFGLVTADILQRLKVGARIDGEHLKPSGVRIVKQLENKTWLEFRLNEGKNREIRRLCEFHGLTIDKLRRVAIEGLHIEGLPVGSFHFLTKQELLKKLGFNKNGEKIKTPQSHFVSSKRGLSAPSKNEKKSIKNKALANDHKHQKYRKENYLKTMDFYKKIKEQKESQEKAPASTR